MDGIGAADGRVAPFLASADSQLSLKTIWCDHTSGRLLEFEQDMETLVNGRAASFVVAADGLLSQQTIACAHSNLTQACCARRVVETSAQPQCCGDEAERSLQCSGQPE